MITSDQIGLAQQEVDDWHAAHGYNVLTPALKTPLWRQWLEKFGDQTIIILCACAGIAILIGLANGELPWDGVAILATVAIATFGATWSEYKADKAFDILKKEEDATTVRVRRDGLLQVVSSADLVPGDVVYLESGDRVPADGEVLWSEEARLDESLMTGESKSVRKNVENRIVSGGTYVVSGMLTYRVTAVGDSTELGSIASALGEHWLCPIKTHLRVYNATGTCQECGRKLVRERERATPLQRVLTRLSGTISRWGVIAALVIYIAMSLYHVVTVPRSSVPVFLAFAVLGGLGLLSLFVKRKYLCLSIVGVLSLGLGIYAACAGGAMFDALRSTISMFMIAVTIVVVAVPEGLPLAVVIALGLGMRKIRKDNNLVRKMAATETIGAATVICSDKTGTLTENRMRVVSSRLFSRLSKDGDLIALVCALNSTAEIDCGVNGAGKIVGTSTEMALLESLRTNGIDILGLRAKYRVLNRKPFSSSRKMMSTLVRSVGESSEPPLLLVKGAPERLLGFCSVVPEDLVGQIDCLAEQGKRTLAIAYKKMPTGTQEIGREDEEGLTLLDVIGIEDPIRCDVPEAVAKCRRAGIRVVMITGDHRKTAVSIARAAGIVESGEDVGLAVISGEELSRMGDEELADAVLSFKVVYRARPETKTRIVTALQKRGEVVAMTGDGTNDAPALKKADVGIAMGVRGTDVAKQASDIVLMDDNFGSIVKAVHWGRTLYENLQKFVQFQLTVNVSVIGISILSPILVMLFPDLGIVSCPLTVLQYLWINLIMDTFAAIAFGLEPPRNDTLLLPPRKSKAPFMTSDMIFNVFFTGIYMAAAVLFAEAVDLFGLGLYRDGMSDGEFALMKASVVFNSYVICQVFHMFNARSVRRGVSAICGVQNSRSFMAIMSLVVVVQVLFIQFGGKFMNVMRLPLRLWLNCIALGLSVLFVGEVLRTVQKRLAVKGNGENARS